MLLVNINGSQDGTNKIRDEAIKEASNYREIIVLSRAIIVLSFHALFHLSRYKLLSVRMKYLLYIPKFTGKEIPREFPAFARSGARNDLVSSLAFAPCRSRGINNI